MHASQSALDRLSHALAVARRGGADAADALFVASQSVSVQMRLGALEDVSRSEGEEIGVRLFIGERSASVATSDLSDAAIEAAVERALAMAREALPDPFAGLAPEALLAQPPFAELDADDGGDVSPERLRQWALECEDAARSVPGVTNSEGSGAAAGRSLVALATSHGFAGSYTGTSYSVSASVVAGTGETMQRDYDWHSARHVVDLDAPARIGRSAGERAVRRVGAVKLASRAMPVVFDPRVSSGLLGHLVGAIVGSAVARRTSFLLDSKGAPIFPAGVHVIDDPLRRRGLRSRPFDGEGVASRETRIVADGVLTGWLMDSASARQLGEAPTGHAQRGTSGPPGAGASNLYMAAGMLPPAELMADIADGLYVTELIGSGVNAVTGDYSRGAAGFRIEKGELTVPVAEVTIAGNLKAMFASLTPASDLMFRYSVNAPTLRVEGMTVAGG